MVLLPLDPAKNQDRMLNPSLNVAGDALKFTHWHRYSAGHARLQDTVVADQFLRETESPS